MTDDRISRPVVHSIMPMDLQAHFGLDFKAPTPEETDMFLRLGALHCRSMVVVDSDLNNNPVMQNAARYQGGVFWDALRTGFLRRAVRESTTGGVASQREVLEGLRRANEDRAAAVPLDYVERLDFVVARAEENDNPLLWRRPDVDKYSLSRLQLYLRALGRQEQKSPSDLIRAVLVEVEERLADGSAFGAADIEYRFRPKDWVGGGDWSYIWDAVTEAQSGNIPFVFKGDLAIGTTPGQRDRFLAAGPNSAGLEGRAEAQLYRPAAEVDMSIEVEERFVGDRPEIAYEINKKKLAELRLEEIEDLREEALGGEFFQARFASTGSGSDLLEGADPYVYSMNEYHERLARAGVLRTRRIERAAVTGALRRVVLTVERQGEVREIIMKESYGSDYPLAQANIVMCDSATIVEQLGEEGARRFGAPSEGTWTYRRPDYRILERLSQPG